MSGRGKGGRGFGRSNNFSKEQARELKQFQKELERAKRKQDRIDEIRAQGGVYEEKPKKAKAKRPPKEESEDEGPKGPRHNRRKVGPQFKKALAILNEPKHLHNNPWVHHVKKFAASKGVTYGCALSMPDVKKGYVKGKYS